MAKNKHPKLEVARRLMSNKERGLHVPPFFSDNWLSRGVAIRKRVDDQIARVRARKAKRLKTKVK